MKSELTVENLQVKFFLPSERTVIECSELVVGKGDFHLVTGPNGSGKTTLLRALGGLLDRKYLVSGSVTAEEGVRPYRFAKGQSLREAATVAYVDQNPLRSLNPDATILENIFLFSAGRKPYHMVGSLSDLRSLLRENGNIPDDIGSVVTKYALDSPLILSGGYLQFVTLLRCLLSPPDVLLLDEPFAHLDDSVAKAARQLIADIANLGNSAIFMVTHMMKEEEIKALPSAWGISKGLKRLGSIVLARDKPVHVEEIQS